MQDLTLMNATRAPLLGREQELGELLGAFKTATDGRPRVVLVSGDAGIGKSRLVAELVAQVGGEATVLIGSCIDTGDTPVPLLPLAALLRQLVDVVGSARVDELLGSLPELAALAGAPVRAPATTDDHAAARVFGAVLDLLAALAAERTTVMVVEDLHWADGSTLALFNFVASSLDRDRVLLVGTYRDHDVARRHPLRSMLASLIRLPVVTTIRLPPLDRRSVEHLVTGLIGERPGERMLDDLLERGEGNPFFTEQLVAAGIAGDRTLPPRVEDLLVARLERLPDPVLDVLRVLAVCRFGAPTTLLVAATGLGEDVVEDAVRAALEAHLLEVRRPDGEPQFRHALLAEAVERTLLQSERRRLHRVAAEHLEANSMPDRRRSAEVARHWHLAGEPRRAFVAAAAAVAGGARSAVGPSVAHEDLTLLIDLWDDVDDAATILGASCLDVLVQASSTAEATGRHEESVALARRAVRTAADDGDRVGEALATSRLIRALALSGELREALSVANQAAADLVSGVPPPVAVQVVTAHVGMLATTGHYRAAAGVARSAIEQAAASGPPAAHAELLNLFGASVAALGDVADGLASLQRAKAVAIDHGLVDAYAHACLNEHLVRRVVDDLDTLLESARSALDSAGSNLNNRSRSQMHGHVAEVLFRLGRWDETDAVLAAAPRGTGWTELSVNALLSVGLAIERGDLEYAGRWLDRGDLDAVRGYPPNALLVAMLQARLALARRQPDRAIALIEDALADPAPVSLVQHGCEAVAIAMEACAAVGADDARTTSLLHLADRALRLADAVGDDAQRLAWRAVASAWVADDEHRSARWRDAVEALDAARLGFEAARARFRWAQALVARGERDDAVAALLLARPIVLLDGARPLLTEIDDFARRARLPVEGAVRFDAPGSTGFGLTEREREVLALVADGHTNREIGAQLYISTKTASVHVSNVLRKLGVDSRRHAARLAREAGILHADSG